MEPKYDEAFVKLCVERMTPKKVTHEASIRRCCTCPTCKNVLDEFDSFMGQKVRVTYQHCHFCGQALDWSGERKQHIKFN